MLLKRFSFFIKVFFFIAMSKFPGVVFRLFVAWSILRVVFSFHFSFLAIFVVLFVLVFSFVSGNCNKSYSASLVKIESSYLCIRASMPPSFLGSSFLYTYSLFDLSDVDLVINFLFFLSIWLSSSLAIFRMSSTLQVGLPKCLSLRQDFCRRAWFQEVFSFVWGTLLSFLFQLRLLLLLFTPFESFSHRHWLIVAHWSLSDTNLLISPGLFSVFWSILML